MSMIKRGTGSTGKIVKSSETNPKPCAGCGKILPATSLCAEGLCSKCRKK